jgi:hypothetical protein
LDNGNPTDAAWITRDVQLTAGVIYTMSWNYVGTDYVPFNDGSITSLVPVSIQSNPTIKVNNSVGNYALLGFTNPGTGDYSTNSFGSTGWQISTYEVSVTGTYKLGFAVFNLDDNVLSPALMIDDQPGGTQRCEQGGTNCTSFGGVAPNNPTAPTVPPTVPSTVAPETTTTSTTTTSTTTTTTTTTTVTTETTVTTLVPETTVAPETTVTTVAPTTTTTTTTAPVVIVPPVIEPVRPVESSVPEAVDEPTSTTEPSESSDEPTPTTEVDEVVVVVTVPESEDINEEENNPSDSEETQENEESDLINEMFEDELDEESSLFLATNISIMRNLTADQAEEVFAAINVDQLTDDQKEQITEAVQDAPQEVREAFEEEINIYAEGFDSYVAVGSVVDVQTRRTLIAATTVLATAAAGAALGGTGRTTGGGQNGPNNGPNSSVPEVRSKNEEEGEEPAGELAGLEDEDDEEYTRNSIYKYYLKGEIWERKLSWLGLFKKFISETAALSFTIAGSVIVYVTLSGETRTIALVATLAALAVHYVHVLLKNDEN